MEDKKGMLMSVKDGKKGARDADLLVDNERSLLIASDTEKSNGLSSNASYRSLLSISEDDQKYPSTQELDRSLYMEDTTTWLTSLMHVIKGNVGIGALSLPFAMTHAGIVVGPILLLVTSAITIYCMHLMVHCSHTFCNRTNSLNLGYAQVAEMSIALYYPKARHLTRTIINVLLIITQLGFCCVYFIFVSNTIQEVFQNYVKLDLRLWIAIIVLPVILFSYIRTLKFLTVFSLVSNILYFSGVLCILIYAGETMNRPETLPKFVGFGSLPLAYGAFIFSLEGIGVVLPVENVMASPRDFRWILCTGMSIVVFLYLLLGVLGFSSCGMHCLGSITLNLPNTPYYTVIKAALATAIFLTYFIQFYVPTSIIIPNVQEKLDEKYKLLADYGIRTLLVCATASFAIGIPELGDMISLVGSVGCTSLAIIFPAIIHILTFSYDDSLSKADLVIDIVIIVFGVLGAVSGMYSSIVDVIWNLQHPGLPQGTSIPNSTRASL